MRLRDAVFLPLIVLALAKGAAAAPRDDAILIHHSIGRGLLDPESGAVRDSLATWNQRAGTGLKLWDHDYGPGHPVWGLSDPSGENLGYGYGDEFNNTLQVDGYRELFCTDNAARDSLLANHHVIAFKPGYESIAYWLRTDAELDSARADYVAMRSFFDQHPEKVFVVVTQPPIHRNAPYLDERVDRARALARWLGSRDFLGGRPNVFTFDLFDLLATPDDPGDPWRNTLRYEYEPDHSNSDPHPNNLAHETIGPVLARFLFTLALMGQPVTDVPSPAPGLALAARPNPFNPRVEVAFALPAPAPVRLAIHDLRGRLVRTLWSGVLPAGPHAWVWDGRGDDGRPAASGQYLARLEAGGSGDVRKLTLAR